MVIQQRGNKEIGAIAIATLREAVQIIESIIDNIDKKCDKDLWRSAQNTYGNCLHDLCLLVSVEQSIHYIALSDIAFKSALDSFENKINSPILVQILINSGRTLYLRAQYAEVAEATTFLGRAVGLYRGALAQLCQQTDADIWAQTVYSLSITFVRLGERLPGKVGVRMLDCAKIEVDRLLGLHGDPEAEPIWWAKATLLSASILALTSKEGDWDSRFARLDEAMRLIDRAMVLLQDRLAPNFYLIAQINMAKTAERISDIFVGSPNVQLEYLMKSIMHCSTALASDIGLDGELAAKAGALMFRVQMKYGWAAQQLGFPGAG